MKKLALSCLVFVIALGVTGVAFASWSQTMNIHGTASIGSFDTQFQNVSFVRDTNNVANGSVSSVTAHSFTLSVDHLYPGCEESVNFDVKNTGSVPVQVDVFKITFTPAGGSATNYTLPASLDLSSPTNGKNDIKVSVTGIALNDNIGAGATKANCNLKIHTFISSMDGNDADPGVSGTFAFTLVTVQR